MTTRDNIQKPIGKMILYGILSLASYFILFSNEEIVMEYFNRGGIYAALPIITAFYFSLVHGPFAGNMLSVLGFEPKTGKKEEFERADDKSPI